MDLSVVIPLYNEEESIPELISWLERVMTENQYSYELLLIDDGSTDRSWQVILEHHKRNSAVKGIKFRRNYGKSGALYEGFKAAEGEVVITMDADLQDSPDEIPALFDMIKKEKYDLVSGWKKKRFDPVFTKNIPSKVYNYTVGVISGVKLHDMNCGLKAYRNSVIKSIEVYGDMHRFIPVLAKNAGFKKIGEKVVQHQKRKFGVSKFGWERFLNGFLDLLTLTFTSRFGKKPMHFFGTLGLLSFVIGFGILIYLEIGKLIYSNYQLTRRPLFVLCLVAIIVGLQMFLTGFLAELVSRSSGERNHYLIEKKL